MIRDDQSPGNTIGRLMGGDRPALKQPAPAPPTNNQSTPQPPRAYQTSGGPQTHAVANSGDGNGGGGGNHGGNGGGNTQPPALPPVTPANVDSISPSDPRYNTQAYIDALNAAHPEYGGGTDAANKLYAANPSWGSSPYGNHPYSGHVDQNAIMAVLRRYPHTSDGLRQAFPELMRQGLLPEGSRLEDKATADEIFIPGMGWVDLLPGADTGNPGNWQWSTGGGGAPAPPTPTTGPGGFGGWGGGSSAPPPVAPPPPAPSGPPPRSQEMEDLIAQLQQRANQSLDVDPNDPIIKRQTDSFDATQQRARRDYLGDLAEGSSPYSSGMQRGQARMTSEDVGQNVAAFQADLMARELTARRSEVQSAIDSLGGILTDEEHQALQLELANMDAAIRRYAIDVQNSQYFAGLSQNDKQFYASLNQDNAHFLDTLGFQMSDRQAYWDAVHNGEL